jgi:hypothetical protein
MMQVLIILVGAVILAVIGFVAYLLFLSDEYTCEKYYRSTITQISRSGLLYVPPDIVPRCIIVTKNNEYSRWRKAILILYNRIRGRTIGDEIFIFQEDSNKRRAILIKQAVKAAFLFAELLDTTFVETLESYYSYKFASKFVKGNPEIKRLLQRAYEEAPARKQVVTLDDSDFSEEIVLNPPPKKRSILETTLLPMIISKSKEAIDQNYSLPTKERYRTMFRELIEALSTCSAAVMFIGFLSEEHYIEMFGNAVLRCSNGIIFSALGLKKDKLEKIISQIVGMGETTWGIRVMTESITGKWNHGKGVTKCYWKILCYNRIGPRSTDEVEGSKT